VNLSSGKKSVGEEHVGKIGIHPLVKVRSPGKEVRNRVRRAGDVLKRIVEILQKLDPPGLMARDLLRLAEILEVLVVGSDTNGVLRTKEERAATLETKDNSKEFLIMGVIVDFRWEETTRMEGNGVKPIIVLLGNDHPEGKTGGVGIKNELSIPIRCAQDGLCRTALLQGLESEFAFRCPFPSPKLLG
jgi:hypothetical protein